MDTFRLILPALITLFFSLLFVWILVYIVKSHTTDQETKRISNKFGWAITFIVAFFSIWWLVSLLSINEIPRAVIDRTLNNQMRNNFEDRMVSDTTK